MGGWGEQEAKSGPRQIFDDGEISAANTKGVNAGEDDEDDEEADDEEDEDADEAAEEVEEVQDDEDDDDEEEDNEDDDSDGDDDDEEEPDKRSRRPQKAYIDEWDMQNGFEFKCHWVFFQQKMPKYYRIHVLF